jgi:LEA14-like dessication related protein
MKKYILYLLVFCSVSFFSCTEYKEVTFSGVDNVSLTSLTQKGVEAVINVRIKNPNKMSFTVYKSEMNVTISGINVGKAYIADNVKIKRNSEQSYTFHIKSDFSNLSLADLPRLLSLASSKTLKVNLKGDLKGGKFFVKRSYPVDLTQNVPFGKN